MRKRPLQSLPVWCVGTRSTVMWTHLPPGGSLQTLHRFGYVYLVCLSEWLAFHSLERKWFACHPQPQEAKEGPFMRKAQDWSSICLFYHIELSIKSHRWWWLKVQTAMMCTLTYVPLIYFQTPHSIHVNMGLMPKFCKYCTFCKSMNKGFKCISSGSSLQMYVSISD